MRQEQQRRLAAAAPDLAPRFADGIDALPDGPLLLVANEFLDALPIRQFVRARDRLERTPRRARSRRRTRIGSPGLRRGAGKLRASRCWFRPDLRAAPPGTVVEICPAAAALAASLGERLARRPGLALFVDYGYFPSRPGATLAAVRRHQSAPILDAPGEADLSAHVDFAAFAEAATAAGAVSHGPVPQRDFLLALGAEARHQALSRRAAPAQRAALESGLTRLIDPAQMGNLFKVLALTSPGLAGSGRFRVARSRWHPSR